jgi:Flp pilus assembly pilin Flp
MVMSKKPNRRAQNGQGLVEYALIIVLVALVAIIILSLLGMAISRGLGIVAAALGAKHNSTVASGSAVEIQQAECHIVPLNSTQGGLCPGGDWCGKTVLRILGMTSPNIALSDLNISTDRGFADTITTNNGTPNSFLYQKIIADPADSSACPLSVVVQSQSAKVTSLMPIQVYVYQ